MIKNFEQYLKENLAQKRSPNPTEASSLMNKAVRRLKYIKMQKIDAFTAEFIFEDNYETMREAIQSLMELKGYKPYSHEVLVAFLIEFSKISKPEILSFDRYRALRNNAVYRAERISSETCEESLKFLEKFMSELKKEFERRLT